ncbi:MAG: MsnO8 family LLM class oxidoreductase, partial [Telluria sp.]
MRLSVLDQSPTISGHEPAEAIAASLALARHCDALGYNRYWLSEQHNSNSLVSSAPEVLMAAAAATTHRIRIGSAGLMLPHYSALKVAEQFRMLEALAPGRIDLGVSRAPVADNVTARALNPHAHAGADEFPQQIVDLRAWVSGQPMPEGHPFRSISAQPRGATSPNLWLLGTSDYGASLAAQLGLPFGFFHCLRDGEGAEEALALYHASYQPSERYPHPQATLCVWALACDTEQEAQRQLMTRA